MMRNRWERWVARCYRAMDTRPLALCRILIGTCILADLFQVWSLDLVEHLFQTYDDGGLSKVQDSAHRLDDVFGSNSGIVAYWTTVACMVCVTLGVGTRPAILLGVLVYAQLGHIYPPGDRGVDRVLRTMLLCLLFTQSHRRFCLPFGPRRFRERSDTTPAWPAELMIFVMVLIYTSAGVAKLLQQPRWVYPGSIPVLYRIMTDPMAARLDPSFWADFYPLFHLGGWATISLELSSILLLTRFRSAWATVAVFMHIGVAFGMDLGMFSWGMLAIFPVILAPYVNRSLNRWGPGQARGPGWRGPSGSDVQSPPNR